MSASSSSSQFLDPDIPRQLASQTDRAAAIVGGAYVEYHLEQLLIARMRPLSNARKEYLFEGFGPLAGFASKIEVAFALNLFGEGARNDLLIVNTIRNRFAHEITGGEWTFNHPEIKKKCDELRFANKAMPATDSPPATNREKFIATVHWLAGQLTGEKIANPQKMYTPKFLTD